MILQENYKETELKDEIFLENIFDVKNIILSNDIINNEYTFKTFNLNFTHNEMGLSISFNSISDKIALEYLLNNFSILEIQQKNNNILKFIILFNYSNNIITKIFLDDK